VPVLTTANSSGPDVVRPGRTGWVVPARDPAAMVEKLRWAVRHREELAQMAQESYASAAWRTWDDVARDLLQRVQQP
jgi:glycosyltransferase involved in cell wall biosynthesis